MKNVFLLQSEDINKVGDICLFPYGLNIAGKADIGYPVQYIYITSDFKVVLTNDPKLETVQQLTEEQLKDYVNNPCEFVEVENDYLLWKKSEIEKLSDCYSVYFSRENKKQTVEEYEQQGLEKYSHELNQESLEEAAENYNSIKIAREAFIAGAKWQAERMYSEEDMMKAVKFGELYKTESSKSLFEKKGKTPSEALKEWFEQFKKK